MGQGPVAPHLVSLHLGEDLEQLGDVRGGSPCLPVELQDSNQLIFGDFLLKGDTAINCRTGGRQGEGAWDSEPPVWLGLAILPAPYGHLKVPSPSKTLDQHDHPPLHHLELVSLPIPSLCWAVRSAGQATSLQGTEGFRRESPSKKKMIR